MATEGECDLLHSPLRSASLRAAYIFLPSYYNPPVLPKLNYNCPSSNSSLSIWEVQQIPNSCMNEALRSGVWLGPNRGRNFFQYSQAFLSICAIYPGNLYMSVIQHDSANILQTSKLGWDAMHLRNAQVCCASWRHLDILSLLPVHSHCHNNTQTSDTHLSLQLSLHTSEFCCNLHLLLLSSTKPKAL